MYRLRSVLNTIFLCAALLMLSACGKRGALVYPDMDIPAAPASVEVRAIGSSVRLSFVLPVENEAEKDKKTFEAVSLFRQDVPLNEMFCSDCSGSIPFYKTVYLNSVRDVERLGRLVVIVDSDIITERTFRYRLAFQSRNGVRGTLSEPITVAIFKPFSAPLLAVEATPTEAILRISGERPSQDTFAGYAVYRSVKGDKGSLISLVASPVADSVYTDFTLKSGVKYLYSVRSVQKNKIGEYSESLLSNEVEAERSKDE